MASSLVTVFDREEAIVGGPAVMEATGPNC